MKTLLILRHAKSSWKDAGLADHERPLNHRGRRTARLMGRYMSARKALPDLILSSTALRARETAELAIAAMRAPMDLRYDERLYLATVPTLLEVISQIEDDRKRPLLIWHNPGLEDLVFRLSGKARAVPTGALAKISFDIDRWSEAVRTSGVLDWLAKPRDLEET